MHVYNTFMLKLRIKWYMLILVFIVNRCGGLDRDG